MCAAALPSSQSTAPPAARGGHGRRVYSDDEVLEMLVTLHERPMLLSPEAFRARSSARDRAAVLAERLEAYGTCSVSVHTYFDAQLDGYRWLLRREDHDG